jgi:TIR domain
MQSVSQLPESCNSLPSEVVALLAHLQERVECLRWLDGPRDKDVCATLLREYFRRLIQLRPHLLVDGREGRGLFKPSDNDYQDLGAIGLKWIDGSWYDANGWKRHCYLRGNVSVLAEPLEYMTALALSHGRDSARHDAWEWLGKSAETRAIEPIQDGVWFTAGAMAAWLTISDLTSHKNPFEPMLAIWEQGVWPIGHVHSYQSEFVIFAPRVAPIKVFISYKWEDDVRNKWVNDLYLELRYQGIDAKLDRYEVPLGGSFTQYIASKISECDRVLFIITSSSVSSVNEGKGAIGFESQLANAIRTSESKGEFIVPILREGSVSPNFLRDNRWIDFRDDDKFATSVSELVDWLKGNVCPPPLGQRFRQRFGRSER